MIFVHFNTNAVVKSNESGKERTKRQKNKNEPHCLRLCVLTCVRSVASEKKCMAANCYCDITRFCGWHQPNFPISLLKLKKFKILFGICRNNHILMMLLVCSFACLFRSSFLINCIQFTHSFFTVHCKNINGLATWKTH